MMISGIFGRATGDADIRRFTELGILVTSVIILAVSAVQLINYEFFGHRISALDPGSDRGVFGVVDDIALAAAAISAWILAVRVRSARLAATALAGLLSFLAADGVIRLHDHIPHWLAFYLPVLGAAFICLAAIAHGRSRRPWFRVHRGKEHVVVDRLIAAGLLLLCFSLLLHLFGKRFLLDLGLSDTTGLAYQIKAAVKHGTECEGWLLIALGLIRISLADRHHLDAART